MLMMMKSKRSCRTSAIKCVDYALTRCPAACERFVDILGLKTAFPSSWQGIRKVARARGWRLCRRRRARGVRGVVAVPPPREGLREVQQALRQVRGGRARQVRRLAELWAKYSNRVKAVDARLETRTDDIELTPDDLTWRGSAAGCTRWSC